jgi:YD repeat-containing protein
LNYDKKGRLTKVQDSLLRAIQYQYDARDRLVQSTDSDQQSTVFQYNGVDRMTQITFSDGAKVTLTYHPRSGAIHEQIGPGKKKSVYSFEKLRGMRRSSVKNEMGKKAVYVYDDAHHKIEVTDFNGKKTITTYLPCCGKPKSILDVSGKGEKFEYDDSHRLTRKTSREGVVSMFKYQQDSLRLESVSTMGATSTRFFYSPTGQLKRIRKTDGTAISLEYAKKGKIASIQLQGGMGLNFQFNELGQPIVVALKSPNASQKSLHFTYDRTRRRFSTDPRPPSIETVEAFQKASGYFQRELSLGNILRGFSDF